jgi:aryl-alcohol dehydrogenase-like predicted oxidoreductase
MATAEGTQRFLRRAVERGFLHSSNVRPFGRTHLECSALGFGGYRVGGGKQEAQHSQAIRAALRAGVNLLDTSSHYSAGSATSDFKGHHGASENLIGRVIAEAIAAGDVARDELIVCTKVGHVARGSTPPQGSVAVNVQAASQGGGDDWHSIEPGFVEAEVRASLDRLGTPPDFVLLHNPEYFLSGQMLQQVKIAEAWDEMYERLTATFSVMERLCDEGVIASGYGVSANFLSCSFSTTGRPNLYEALAVDRVASAAADAAGGKEQHRLRLVQLPLNAIEGGAVVGRGKIMAEAAEGDSMVADRLGLAVVTNRPLQGIPVPGISLGDWGRQGPSHLQLRDKTPMGTIEALLKRVILEAVGHEPSPMPQSFQQMALRLALSGPSVASTLCGMRSEGYVDDASAVLREAPFSAEQVSKALLAARTAIQEVGGETRRYW